MTKPKKKRKRARAPAKPRGPYQPQPTTPAQTDLLQKLLAPFRKHELKDDLAVIVDDHEAIKFVASWSRIRTVWKPVTRKVPDLEVWDWIWRGAWYDLEGIAALAGVSEKRALELMRVCEVIRAIYPDGTVSKFAKELVTEFRKQRWPGKQRGRPAGSKDRGKRKKTG